MVTESARAHSYYVSEKVITENTPVLVVHVRAVNVSLPLPPTAKCGTPGGVDIQPRLARGDGGAPARLPAQASRSGGSARWPRRRIGERSASTKQGSFWSLGRIRSSSGVWGGARRVAHFRAVLGSLCLVRDCLCAAADS